MQHFDNGWNPGENESKELIADASRLLSSAVLRDGLNSHLVLKTPDGVLRTILAIVAASDYKELPDEMLANIAGIVGGGGEGRVKKWARPVTDALRGQKVSEASRAVVSGALLRIARSGEVEPEDRLKALLVVPGKRSAAGTELEAFVMKRLEPDAPAPLRSLAADALVKMPLDRDRLLRLIVKLKDLGAIEIARILPAFAESRDESVGIALIDTLKALPTRSALRSDTIKPILEKYPDRVREAAKSFYDLLDADRAGERQARSTFVLAR